MIIFVFPQSFIQIDRNNTETCIMAKRSDEDLAKFHSRLRMARNDEERLGLYVEFLRSPGLVPERAQLREADTALLMKSHSTYPVLAGTLYALRGRLRMSEKIDDNSGAASDLSRASRCVESTRNSRALQLKIEVAELYGEACQYEDAMKLYSEVCETKFEEPRARVSQEIQDEWAACIRFQGEACYRLGNLQLLQGNISESLRTHQHGQELREKLGEPETAVASLAALARVHAAGPGDLKERRKKTKEFVERSLEAARACVDAKMVAHPVAEAYEYLAETELALNRADKAGPHLTFARMLYGKLNDAVGLARTHLLEGKIREAESNIREAIQQYEMAYQKLDACGSWRSLPQVLVAIGRAQREMGQKGNARFTLVDAVEIAMDAGDKRVLRDALLERSLTYEQLGQWRNALEDYKEAYKIARALSDEQYGGAIARLQTEFDARNARDLEHQLRRAQRNAGRGRQEANVATARLGMQLERARTLERKLKGATRALANHELGKVKSVLEEITGDVSRELTADDKQWHELLKRVIDVDKDFVECLHEKFPSLTKAELQVCGLEVLGRTAREIAEARGSMLKTVYKQRQMIRRKTACPITSSLEDHLKSICK